MIQLRLDRDLCFSAYNFWSNISCSTLSRHISDHNSFLLYCMLRECYPSLFHFRNMKTTHKDFFSVYYC